MITTTIETADNPSWWDATHDFAWNHVKRAMKQHWNRTQSHTYINGGMVFNRVTGEQIVLPSDQSTFDESKSACRFGYGARIEYGDTYPLWNDDLEIRLVKEWRATNPNREETWEHEREAIRYGWEFDEKEAGRNEEAELSASIPSSSAEARVPTKRSAGYDPAPRVGHGIFKAYT
jgi:hypothetical protein